jgi:DNA-binding beta-propeller fold protein YncE
LTKLLASSGAVVGTFTVGSGAEGVAFDGANIWVGDQFNNNVTKFRASDGSTIGVFNTVNPVGIAFDGANVWVANGAGNTVSKL